MSPRVTALMLSGLLAGSLLASTTWAQGSRQSMSLAERMAAMRRGWSQGVATAPRNAEQQEAAPTDGEEQSGSLFSNFFGRRDAAPNRVPATQVPTRTNPRAGSAAATQRTTAAAQPNIGGAPSAASSDGFTLPGLGGSPLPTTAGAARTSTAGGPDISQEIVGDYPVIRGDASSAAATSQSRFATRPGTAPSAPSSATNSTPSARQSPNRRTVPQVDPSDLRRELVGSFSSSPSRSTPSAPRTARAGASDAGAAASPFSNPTGTADEPSRERTLQSDDSLFAEADAEPDLAETEPSPDVAAPPAVGSRSSAAGAARAFGATSDLGSAFGASSPSPESSRRSSAAPLRQPSARRQQAFGESAATDLPLATGGDPTVLVSNQTPVITTNIRGPRQILLGREAIYRVQLRNQGDTAAEGIAATIRIPAWADVIDTTATQGVIQQTRGATQSVDLQWQLARLEARGSETLDLRLVPRESRPLELGVSWTLTPIGSRAVVEVQEPKLQMTVTGPEEVLFNEPQLFRLTLTNPGTGPAEGVKIELMPPGGGHQAATSHSIGDLPAGASRTVEVELTAREAGKLFVKAVASAAGGLSTEAAQEIFCRKAELEVDWRGPETKYAGTPATYFFRVRNPGTAPAENVAVQVMLPAGAEFTSASDGQSYDAKQRQVEWRVGTLGPGDDSYMELRCIVNTAGANQFRVSATSTTGDLTASKLAETNVVALADLKLEISDPSGPVAVGQQAVYEIRVKNRGSNTAKEVNIVALFSEGIEPDQVEGAMYTVADGRVTFRTIDELPAGRDVTLRIRAHALTAGTHIFRAEVLCRELEIKLAAEETTLFYADDIHSEDNGAAGQTAASVESFAPTTR